MGQIAEGLKTCVFGTFLLFYYNQVLGLSGDLAGLAIFIALIFDAVTDPIAGSVSDRWQGPRGRRHPFMYASAVPLGLSFMLLFAPLVSVVESGEGALFGWMLVCTVLTRASMTLYHVPHMALGAELSDDYDARTVLVAIRHFFGATGFIIAFVLGYGWFFAPSDEFVNGQLNAAAYPPYAITLGIIMTLSILVTSFGTRSRIPYLPKPRAVESRVTVADVFIETFEAMKNVSFRWIMIGFVLIIAAWGMAGVTGLYVYTFFWELNGYQILFISLMGPVGSMFGYMFSRVYFSWLDKKNAMIVAGLLWMVIHAIPVLAYLAGLAPPPGTWSVAFFLAFIAIFGGIGVGQVVVGIGTTMADIADENELKTGRRQEGVFFGASAFANKCSAGLGTMLAGFVLEWIDWPTGQAIRTAADIPPETLLNLAIIAGPVIGLLTIPGVLCFRGYRLNRSKVAEIQAELRATAA
jgi:Na+/melibiose symporter-like transporter